MNDKELRERIESCDKILIGLGEEWKLKAEAGVEDSAAWSGEQSQKTQNQKTQNQKTLSQRESLLKAYATLHEMIKDKDYFIITMATDALIYDTPLGSQTETVTRSAADRKDEAAVTAACSSPSDSATGSSAIDDKTQALMDRLFPVKERPLDTRWQRIVAPCGNVTWRQCSQGCTKDIWEPGEIPDDRCPHCGAPLTGNTIDASPYIEEGYLPQWNRYTQWLTGTLNQNLVILELGTGFANPGVIRFPFEKTAFFNQKSYLYRVNETFPQITEELKNRAASVAENSVNWILDSCQSRRK